MYATGRDFKELDILLFREVLDHMARIDRVLTCPGGSLLLSGRSGVGRRSALSVVAHMHQMEVFTPHITRTYGLKQFRADLKSVMQQAGVEGTEMILLLEDHQIVDLAFLEMVNSLLSSGEVPGLFTPEELEPLLAPIRDQMSQDGYRGSLLSYFSSRVRANLHVVLVMDSSSDAFAARCESNPAFYSSCSFQSMEGWSRQSMLQVPQLFLQQSSLSGAAR